MNLRVLRSVLILVLALLLGACASSGPSRKNLVQSEALPAPDTTTSAGAYEGGTDYRIGAQDLLEISVFGIDDLSRTVRVNSNGQISLPLVGGLMAGGKTIPELEKLIGAALEKGYLQNPQVTVFVKEFTSQRVTLEGAVAKPGIYPLTGRTTLLQAIALGGGVTNLADLRGVIIFRQIGGKRMGAVFDLKAVRSGNAEDPVIYGDDIIVIEQSGSKTAMRRILEAIPILNVFTIY